jgi:hypothetical protein
VAMGSDGRFVVTWFSHYQDADQQGVYAQRYDGAGLTVGTEFQANVYTTGPQSAPQVAMTPLGAFVIVWQSAAQDGSLLGIFAQKYRTDGTLLGSLPWP